MLPRGAASQFYNHLQLPALSRESQVVQAPSSPPEGAGNPTWPIRIRALLASPSDWVRGGHMTRSWPIRAGFLRARRRRGSSAVQVAGNAALALLRKTAGNGALASPGKVAGTGANRLAMQLREGAQSGLRTGPRAKLGAHLDFPAGRPSASFSAEPFCPLT